MAPEAENTDFGRRWVIPVMGGVVVGGFASFLVLMAKDHIPASSDEWSEVWHKLVDQFSTHHDAVSPAVSTPAVAETPHPAASTVAEAPKPAAASAPADGPEYGVPKGEFDFVKQGGFQIDDEHPNVVYKQAYGRYYAFDRVMVGNQPTEYAHDQGRLVAVCDEPKHPHAVCPPTEQQKPAPVVEHPKPAHHPKVVKAAVVPPPPAPEPTPAPAPEPPAPVETPKPVEVVKDQYAVYGADLKCESGCKDQIGVVTRDGLPAGSVWEDKDGDGDYVKVQRVPGSADHFAKELVIDRNEVHLPDRATVEHDIEELGKHGFRGTTVVYNLTDTEGRNIVACYNTRTHHWDLFNINHSDDPVEKIPPGHEQLHYIFDSRTLNADLAFARKTY